MKKFGRFIAEKRVMVLIIAAVLIIPAVIGMACTRINYDILTYLPQELDSMRGQKVLEDVYSDAATSMLVVDNMEPKDVSSLKDKIKTVDGVDNALWISDVLDNSVPKEILPDNIKDKIYNGKSTLVVVKFKEGASSEKTQSAIASIKSLLNKQCFLSGMSAIVKDTKDLIDHETPYYIIFAVIFSTVILLLSVDSFLVPILFLLSIGIAILYNMGTNIFLGEISYVTKALAAALQMGVTMDFSIFLLHRYDEEREKTDSRHEAMANAISNAFVAIGGSAFATSMGFIALCSMQLSLGKDIGIVMAKGVIIGVICSITILPAMILVFDKAIHKYKHRTFLPSFNKTADFVTKHYKIITILFVLAFIPSIYLYKNTEVYYNLDESLPKDMESVIATNKLKDTFNMMTTHFVIISDKLPAYKQTEIIDKIEKVDGVNDVIGYEKFLGAGIPDEFVPSDVKEVFKQGGYNLILVNSKYKAAKDEENAQIGEINKIIKGYDESAMIAGEGSLTKDLIDVADKDIKNVALVSIAVIFVVLVLLFKSPSIPAILVVGIELAIFINLGIPYLTGTKIPFVADIVLGTIQLGATVDYAILLTSRYKEQTANGLNKIEAMNISIRGSAKAITTSALSLAAATVAISVISKMELLTSLCFLIARGAVISMLVIIFIIPALLIICDGIITKTTKGWGKKSKTEPVNISA
ncbi:hypothetical protein SAMN02745163_00300 [Clostridium cavendishii DSM 21758]|uniref:SSD domain-containing protein n=1 Tax=Clostridium cavendishii DSM 21758 TaxID=1121302 RepID=A0A1M6BB52_9CLOT|nr:hypothetical protein SAMN02745163_00300 [Clostridium cavendishii DSM 21758]